MQRQTLCFKFLKFKHVMIFRARPELTGILDNCSQGAKSCAATQLAKTRGFSGERSRGMSIMRRSRCMVMTMAAACLMVLLGCDDEETTGTYLECSSFNKSGVSPVTDAATCREACVTAEGLVEVGGSLEDWSGSSGSGKCACYEGTNGYGGFETVCQDFSYSR